MTFENCKISLFGPSLCKSCTRLQRAFSSALRIIRPKSHSQLMAKPYFGRFFRLSIFFQHAFAHSFSVTIPGKFPSSLQSAGLFANKYPSSRRKIKLHDFAALEHFSRRAASEHVPVDVSFHQNGVRPR